MEILLIAIIIGLIPAAIAHGKGGNFLLWWLFGAALWIVAMPMAIMMKDTKAEKAAAQAAVDDAATKRKCPFCAELIQREAVVCRYCGRDLPPLTAPAGPGPSAQIVETY